MHPKFTVITNVAVGMYFFKLIIGNHGMSYLSWNTVTIRVLRVNAVCSGNTTAAPKAPASFS